MLEFSRRASGGPASRCLCSKVIRVITALAVLLIGSIGVCTGCSAGSIPTRAADHQASTRSLTGIETAGLSGDITQVVVGKLTEAGPEVVYVATTDGLYSISEGTLRWRQLRVRSVALIDDISGDGIGDIVASRGSCICACDGATGDALWQASPRQRVFQRDLGWSDQGFEAGDVQVVRADDSEIITVTSGCCLFGLSAQDGDVLWKFEGPDRLFSMAVVPDQDGDGTDEVVVGTETGFIRLISGDSGRVRWKKKMGEEWTDEYGQLMYGWAGSIAGFDDRGSAVVVGTHDGRVCLLNLERGNIGWENRVASREDYRDFRAWPVPDVTGDGLPEILVGVVVVAAGGGGMPRTDAVLLGGVDGGQVWSMHLNFSYMAGPEVAYVDSQPVLLDSDPQAGIRMVSIKDGSLVRSLKLATLDGETPLVKRLASGKYLAYSNGSDLAAVSGDGSVEWYYPRVGNILVKRGLFTSDLTPDLLVCGESTQPANRALATRLISVVDGATHGGVWRYDVPRADFATLGGLSNVQVVGDVTEDGIQDVVAYRASTVFRFSGADGALTRFEVGGSITDVQTLNASAKGIALLIQTEDGLLLLDKDGNRLWGSTWADWGSDEAGVVQVLGDLNQDGMSDMVLLFANRILVAKSIANSPPVFEIHHSILASENKVIEFKELANDIDGDSVQEVAYFEYDKEKSAETRALVVASPVSGEVWHRWDMPAVLDLACADFNGDGFQDSLLHRQGRRQQQATLTPSGAQYLAETKLEVYSGRDASLLWDLTFDEDWWDAGNEKMPAAAVGDISGDGIEDLAVCSIRGTYGGENAQETRLSAYSVVNGALLKEVVLPVVQENGRQLSGEKNQHGFVRWYGPGPGDRIRSMGDLNGDDHHDIAVLASFNRFTADSHCLAFVDLYGGQVLSLFPSFTSLDAAEVYGPGLIALPLGGAVYSFRTDNTLRLTSPVAAGATGSPVRIAWDGVEKLAYTEVFVDGEKSAQTRESQLDLRVAPGAHQLVIRSTDEHGVVSYAMADFVVRGGVPWVSILAGLSVVALLSLYFSATCARVMSNRRAQRLGS